MALQGTVRPDALAPITKRRLTALIAAADLPEELPWPSDVSVSDLAKTGTHADRFADGTFKVVRGAKEWTVDGGRLSAVSASINWTFTIAMKDGAVAAIPMLAGRTISGPGRVEDDPVGFGIGTIGKIGALTPTLPAFSQDVMDDFGLPCTYATRKDAKKLRRLLADTLTPL